MTAGWEAAPRLLACSFSLPKVTTSRGSNGKQGSVSEVSSHLTEITNPCASRAVSPGHAQIKGQVWGSHPALQKCRSSQFLPTCLGQALLLDPSCQHCHLSIELLPQNVAEQHEGNMMWALFSLLVFGCEKCCKWMSIDKKFRTWNQS